MRLTPYGRKVTNDTLLSALKLVYEITWTVDMLLMHSLLCMPQCEYEQLPICGFTHQMLFPCLDDRQKLGPETSCWRNWVGYAKCMTHRPFPGAYDGSFCRYWSPKHARNSTTITIGYILWPWRAGVQITVCRCDIRLAWHMSRSCYLLLWATSWCI